MSQNSEMDAENQEQADARDAVPVVDGADAMVPVNRYAVAFHAEEDADEDEWEPNIYHHVGTVADPRGWVGTRREVLKGGARVLLCMMSRSQRGSADLVPRMDENGVPFSYEDRMEAAKEIERWHRKQHASPQSRASLSMVPAALRQFVRGYRRGGRDDKRWVSGAILVTAADFDSYNEWCKKRTVSATNPEGSTFEDMTRLSLVHFRAWAQDKKDRLAAARRAQRAARRCHRRG